MPDFTALVTPPKLVGPDMKPANGDIYVRSTNNVPKSGVIVIPFQAHGKIVDGEFKALDGGPLMLVVTPEGVALEIFADIVQEGPTGRRDKYSINRTVSVPNQSTVTWDALVDVVPVGGGTDYEVPAWVTTLLTDAVAAGTTATDAANLAIDALAEIDQKVADVPTPAQIDAKVAAVTIGSKSPGAGGLTDGDNVRLGKAAYSPNTGGTTYVQGGATNYENVIGGNPATVNTGSSNLSPAIQGDGANRSWSAILHGYDNVNNGWANIVSGFHHITETLSNHVTISGGATNKALATTEYGTIAGGIRNTISKLGTTISGGEQNTASGALSSIGGGLNQVASGDWSTLAGGIGGLASGAASSSGGGSNNKATGNYSTVPGGDTNEASGGSSVTSGGARNKAIGSGAAVSGGTDNQAQGSNATVSGGSTNLAIANFSTIYGGLDNQTTAFYATAGGRNASAYLYGASVKSSGMFTARGDAQTMDVLMRRETTSAAVTELFLDGAAARLAPATGVTWAITGTVVAKRVDVQGEAAMFEVKALATRTGSGTPTIVGAPTVTQVAASDPSWAVALAADAGTGSIKVNVTGAAGKTIRWVASLELLQVAA